MHVIESSQLRAGYTRNVYFELEEPRVLMSFRIGME